MYLIFKGPVFETETKVIPHKFKLIYFLNIIQILLLIVLYFFELHTLLAQYVLPQR